MSPLLVWGLWIAWASLHRNSRERSITWLIFPFSFPISMLSNMTGDPRKKERWNIVIYKRYGMRPTLDSLANALRNAPMTRHNISLGPATNPFLPSVYLYLVISMFNCLWMLFYISQGRILMGCGGSYVQRQPDVHVQGTGVEPIHCYIENINGTVSLYPLGEMTSVDGLPVATPIRLTQGKIFRKISNPYHRLGCSVAFNRTGRKTSFPQPAMGEAFYNKRPAW